MGNYTFNEQELILLMEGLNKLQLDHMHLGRGLDTPRGKQIAAMKEKLIEGVLEDE